MKEKISGKVILFSALTVFIFSGCSKKAGNSKENTVITDYKPREVPAELNIDEKTVPDLDLSKMSATMVYAEVFNMLIDPISYDGKIVRIKGAFNSFIPNNTTDRALTVIVSDATACCQQGIEFKLLSPKKFPEDYPQLGTEIQITGEFIYSQTAEGYDYFYLLANDLEMKN